MTKYKNMFANLYEDAGKIFGVLPEEINSSSKQEDLVLARQFIQWVLNVKCNISISQIARITNRDRSTVKHGIRRFTAYTRADNKIKDCDQSKWCEC